jgi:hypothetical protein
MPYCWKYYVKPYDGPTENFRSPNEVGAKLDLKSDTPALWRALCTSTLSNPSLTTTRGDFMRLRSLSVQVPLDFALPDRIHNAQLTLSVNNALGWQKGGTGNGTAIRDPDMGSSEGLIDGPGTTTIPTPVGANVSIRVQF